MAWLLLYGRSMLKDAPLRVPRAASQPARRAVAVLSLALGIGGAASVFTVLNAVVLRDLPVPNPQQLYAADKHRRDEVFNRYSWPVILQAQQEVQGRAELFAATPPTQMQVRLAARHRRCGAQQRPARVGRVLPGDAAARAAGQAHRAARQRRRWRQPGHGDQRRLLGAPLPAQPGDRRPRADRRRREPHRHRHRRARLLRPVPRRCAIPRCGFRWRCSRTSATRSTPAPTTRPTSRKPWFTQPGIEWLTLFARVPEAANVAGVGCGAHAGAPARRSSRESMAARRRRRARAARRTCACSRAPGAASPSSAAISRRACSSCSRWSAC